MARSAYIKVLDGPAQVRAVAREDASVVYYGRARSKSYVWLRVDEHTGSTVRGWDERGRYIQISRVAGVLTPTGRASDPRALGGAA